MPQIKKILFPVDFSEACIGAARYMEAFAGQFEAEVMLLHAVGMGEHNLAGELLPARQAQLEAFLADELKYFSTQRICVTGDAASAIAGSVKAWNPNLIMMATHGVGYFRRHLLGSVTAKTLHDVACPVWTGAHTEMAPALDRIHCRRILCAVDLGERDKCVLGWASWLAQEYQAALSIVHATAAADASPAAWHLEEEFQRYAAEQARDAIRALQAETGTACDSIIRPGDPGEVVAEAVRDFGADLVVIGRHGTAGVSGFLRRNAYSIMRGSPCPVISI